MMESNSKPLTLLERLQQINEVQARRFSRLNNNSRAMASEGIVRHLRACERSNVAPDPSAVREIIDDALNGRRVFAEANEIYSKRRK